VANLPASDRGPERMWYGSAAASEYHDMDWLRAYMRADEDVQIRSLTNDMTILVLAGPDARAVLQACARGDWSNDTFPFLRVRECEIGFVPATVMRVSFSGELAYEIHVPNASLYAAYLALRAAGENFDLRLFGARAVDSMRMEKGFLHWKADLITEFDPYETCLTLFVRIDKGPFVGREALRERLTKAHRKQFVTLHVKTDHAPAHAGASLMEAGRVVGTITSGAWGHRIEKNLAYAFVETDFANVGATMSLDLCGDLIEAEVIAPGAFDPEHKRMRG